MIGPPEKIHIDMRDTDDARDRDRAIGKGTVAWLPWELGALYYRHSLPAHAGLFRDVMNRLYRERQVKTDAHPLVEMTLMRQAEDTLLHLVNFSGHSQTGYFAPVAMRGVRVEVLGAYRAARTVRHPGELKIERRGAYSEITVPELTDYELVVLK